jgi:hypothetical protein
MNERGKFIYLIVLAVGCGVPGVSFAGKCAGNNINNLVSWEPTEISKGTTLATLRITSVTVSDDPSAAYHLVSGECVGSFLTTPDGKTQGSGSCARRDKEGDVLNEEWVSTDGGQGTEERRSATSRSPPRVSGNHSAQGKMAAVRWVGNCSSCYQSPTTVPSS